MLINPNSNITNIKFPTKQDAESFRASTASAFLGVVICLAPSIPTSLSAPIPPPTPIGRLSLSAQAPHTQHHRNTELGLDILPLYQGKGYGREAINWALNYAFKRAGFHKVRIRAFEWNEGAVRLYERVGFKHEGRERESIWHEGRFWDSIEMGMIDREWWELRRQEAEQEKKESEAVI
ncbi:unnamed protein product [Periconia digitata]|uniref:N-acetyltransferase domain-containing protein n=1 Tax=Periconia digitata TaxID=1303443 RepID=A0A9W4XJS0_9PLEO|nr:unnamed protein product [Periconia digitata]